MYLQHIDNIARSLRNFDKCQARKVCKKTGCSRQRHFQGDKGCLKTAQCHYNMSQEDNSDNLSYLKKNCMILLDNSDIL